MEKEQILDILPYFRTLGFFSQHKTLSDTDLMKMIDTQCAANNYYGSLKKINRSDWLDHIENSGIRTALIESDILGFDTVRTWFIGDYMGGNEDFQDAFRIAPHNVSYKKFIEELLERSNGKVVLEDLDVTGEEYEPIKIKFNYGGAQHTLNSTGDGGVLYVPFLRELNDIIQDSGYSFQFVQDPQYGNTFFYCLSHKERKKIEKDRGWSFSCVPHAMECGG